MSEKSRQSGRGDDDIADALHDLAKHVVGEAERFEELAPRGDQRQQTVVGNGVLRVHRGRRRRCRPPSSFSGLRIRTAVTTER